MAFLPFRNWRRWARRLAKWQTAGRLRHSRRSDFGRYVGLRLEELETRALPSVFSVTSTSDSGSGSLRQAILDANARQGLDTITFNIGSGVQTIAPLSPLPGVTDPVLVDGTT